MPAAMSSGGVMPNKAGFIDALEMNPILPVKYVCISVDDVVQNLMSKGIIDSDISDILIAMRRFRNIVVHRYGKLEIP